MTTNEGIKAHEALIDRLIKKEEVTDTEIWLAFWDLHEPEARMYCEDRWFPRKKVTQNHITRKLRRWFPQVEAAKLRQKIAIQKDTTHPKAYRCQNWSSSYGYTLGWVAAGSTEEASRLFQIFLPVTEDEFDKGTLGNREIDLPEVVPESEVEGRVVAGNADVIADLLESASRRRQEVERHVKKLNASISTIDSKVDALQMFIISTGGDRTAETTSETQDESAAADEEVSL